MIAQWYVFFERGRTPLGHVWAMGFDPDGGWAVVDPHLGWTEVRVVGTPQALALIGDATPRCWGILKVDRGERRGWWPGLWCVGEVRRLVASRSGALSPRGLWRDLVRAGAEQVYHRESQDTQGHRRPGSACCPSAGTGAG